MTKRVKPVTAGFELEGIPELKAVLKRVGATTGKKLIADAAVRAMEPIESAAKSNAPVATGKLKRSIKIQIWEQTPKKLDAEVYVEDNKAHLVEYGHGGPRPAPAHPFLRPAFDAHKGETERRFGQEVGKIIEDAAR